MKLWIDDMRDAPDDSWTVIRKVQPAIVFINLYGSQLTEVSLDHDIENRPDDETFKPVAYFLGQRILYDIAMGIYEGKTSMKCKVRIHSDNPVGARDLQTILAQGFGIEAPWEPYTTQADFAKKFGL